jgi:CubicO group peptidase (beta-lactamase class C family)
MFSELSRLAYRLIVEPKIAPAAAVAVAFRKGGAWHFVSAAAGQHSPSRSEPVTTDTPFDLASVSKPFVAAAVVRLAKRRGLTLQAPLAELLPEALHTATEFASLESLLSHRAGLLPHVALYAPLFERRPIEHSRALILAANATRNDCVPQCPGDAWSSALYSDLGYVLAGAAAERAFAEPLDELVLREVAAPLRLVLGSARQWLSRDAHFSQRVVPTEVVPWRGGELWGVVHDDNAWALAGHGLCGHAGLFAAAEPVARFGAAMLDALKSRSDAWLDRDGADFLTRPRPGGTLRAGFDGKSTTDSCAGARAGLNTFGHLGFTGTSLWCDPDAERVAVLLTNRVRAGNTRAAIQKARPIVHDALFALAETWAAE